MRSNRFAVLNSRDHGFVDALSTSIEHIPGIAVAAAVIVVEALVEAGRNLVHSHSWLPIVPSGSSCCCYCSCCFQQAMHIHKHSARILVVGREAADTYLQSCSVRLVVVEQTGQASARILAGVDRRLVGEVADHRLVGEVADHRLVEGVADHRLAAAWEVADRTRLEEAEVVDRTRLVAAAVEEAVVDRTRLEEVERQESSCCMAADHTAKEDRR